MNENTTINIRSIQHFQYCPRRFGLLEIENDWEENAFVVKANLLHEKVHDGSHSYNSSAKVVRSSVVVYNDLPEYDLYGITDCVEFVKDSKGVLIPGINDKCRVQIVEYKPKAPKGDNFYHADALQVFAQKICADYVWNTNADCFIYYCDTKKRVKLPFDEKYDEYDIHLKDILKQMREIIASEKIPNMKKGQKCNGCSLKDVCFAKTVKYSIQNEIKLMMEGD